MDLSYKDLIPREFDSASRIWVYQAQRSFVAPEVEAITKELLAFTKTWHTHGTLVKGFAGLFFDRFIVLMADESDTKVSGCSTDSSVHLIKGLESTYANPMFDRQVVACVLDNAIQVFPLSNLTVIAERLGPDTLYFDNTIQTKRQWVDQWIVPINSSWLGKTIQKIKPAAIGNSR